MDEELLAAAQKGDRPALEALLAKHRAGVLRHGLRVCATTEDAEEAVQLTLWSASRSIANFRRAAAVSTWLFTIVRRYCLRLLSRERFYLDLDELFPWLADPALSADTLLEHHQLRALLADALSGLEPAHREVLVLRDVQGLTAPEAARTLGIGVAALKSRLHRARTELRRRLQNDLQDWRGVAPAWVP